MCAADGLCSRFGEAEVLHFAFANQVLHRSGYVLNRHVRINAVLIEQVNDIGSKTLKRSLGHLLDVFRLAIEARKRREVESELCGDYHLLAERSKGFAYELFIGERAVNFGRVKECDATFDSRPNQCNRFLLVGSRAIAKAQSHAAES